MARSSYIYVVSDAHSLTDGPLAAFTVKRELIAALARFPFPEKLTVFRVQDAGVPGQPWANRTVRLEIADLLNESIARG